MSTEKNDVRIVFQTTKRNKKMLESLMNFRGSGSASEVIRNLIADAYEKATNRYGVPKDDVGITMPTPVAKLTKEEKAELARKEEDERLTRICEDTLGGVCIRDNEGNLIGCHAFSYSGRLRHAQRLNVHEIESFPEYQYMPNRKQYDESMERMTSSGWVPNFDPKETMAEYIKKGGN